MRSALQCDLYKNWKYKYNVTEKDIKIRITHRQVNNYKYYGLELFGLDQVYGV